MSSVDTDWSRRRPRVATPSGLAVRCLGWGIGIGSCIGAVVGAVVGFLAGLNDGSVGSGIGLALVGVLYGVVLGALIAVPPTVLGSALVTGWMVWRHPHPSSGPVVRRDLRVIFLGVVGVLDAAVLILDSADGDEVLFVLALNALVIPMLFAAERSIGRWWSGTP